MQKNPAYNWTHVAQTHFVQGSTTYKYYYYINVCLEEGSWRFLTSTALK